MIDTRYFWINVIFLAIGTLTIRGSFIALSSRIKISDSWKQTFSFIPAAILPAFVAPSVFFHEGHVPWALGKERFLLLIIATVVCYYSRSTILTIAVGMGLLFLIS